jgi:hypothetical protein
MRATWTKLLGVAVVLAFVTVVMAADDKEVTLKGTVTCAKCDLKVEGQTSCATVIKVKEGGKDVVYYFDTASHKKEHKAICQSPKEGSVTGKVSEKGGKKVIEVSKVDLK